jgi:hypothetical protein
VIFLGGLFMDYLKMLFISAVLMAMIFPAITSADSAERYNARKNQSINRNIKGKAGAGYSTLKVKKSHGRTIVTGTVVNRRNKAVTGKNADAAGSEIKVQGDGGNVYVRGNVINSGNVTAIGKGTATAAGSRVTVTGARNADIRVNMRNTGNVTASASGRGKVESSATGSGVNVRNTTGKVRVGGNIRSNAAITAISNAK